MIGGASFLVYDNSVLGISLLAENLQGPSYNLGLNTLYKNPDGTGLFRVFNGTASAVNAATDL